MYDRITSALRRAVGLARAVRITRDGVGLACTWEIWHHGPDGALKGYERGENLIVATGINFLLENGLKSVSLYVGLMGTGPTVADGDTMASHAGWTEVTAYSQSNRPALTLGTAASKSIDNSASKASFSINGTATLGGAFVASNNTKGGTTGTLINAKAFAAERAALSGDTMTVQLTYTGSST